MSPTTRNLGFISLVLGLVGCGGSSPTPPDAATGPSDGGALDGGALDGGDPVDAGPLMEGEVRALTLNLRCLQDDWPARRSIITPAIAAARPHLIGFQEACAGDGDDNVEALARAVEAATGLRYEIVRRVTHRAWDRFDEGIAVLSRVPVRAQTVVSLPTGVFPRALILVRVELDGGDSLVFGTTHLDHQDGLTRLRQTEAIVSAMSDFADPDEPRILTGDFNSPPTGAVAPILESAGYSDMWRLLRPSEAGPTFPSTNPSTRIDYVWTSGEEAGRQPRRISRILDRPQGGVWASDHLGLSAAWWP